MEEVLTKKQPLIMEKIDYLDKEIARLFELVFSLETRLKPVLVPEAPPSLASKEAKISPNLISQILQDKIGKIIILQKQIGEIQKRLEV